MATAAQFLKGQKIKPVVVIAGKNPSIIHFCLEVMRLQLPRKTEYYDLSSVIPTKGLLQELGAASNFAPHKCVVYRDVQRLRTFGELVWYTSNPTPGITLVITANNIRREDGERWIPSSKKVLYVDCSNITDLGLNDILKTLRVPESDIPWLIEHCAGDLDEIFRIIDLLDIFQKIEPGLVRQIVGSTANQSSVLAGYSILDNGDMSGVVRQIKRRCNQLINLSAAINASPSMMDLVKRTDLEPFMVKRLMGVARGTTPDDWITKLAQITEAEPLLLSGAPASRQHLELILQ